MILRIGTRDSSLAVRKAEMVRDAIAALRPDLECRIVPLKIGSDVLPKGKLDGAEGKALFVRELDAALAREEIDIVVHSLKDVQTDLPEELPIAAVLPRSDPRDAVLLTSHPDESEKPIGTRSHRRVVQLRRIYPYAAYAHVGGSIQSRIRKLENGDLLAVVASASSLSCLGMEHYISKYLDTRYMIPAAGQGVIAIQTRRGFLPELWQALNDRDTWDCAGTERAFLRAMGGGSDQIAAYATVRDDTIHLVGMDEEGRRAELDGPRSDPYALGAALARMLRAED